MMKPTKVTLSQVSIGVYNPEDNQRVAVEVTNDKPCISMNALYDQRMGYLSKPSGPNVDIDYAAMFGNMGYIPLRQDMLNPIMEKPMLDYLNLFRYVNDIGGASLQMKDGISHLITKHDTLHGYRKLKAISQEISASNPWRVDPSVGGVKYKVGTGSSDYESISGKQLKELLRSVTRRYTINDANQDDPPYITLEDVGLNTSVAKPEDWIMGQIPVLPNGMRAPMSGSHMNEGCVTGNLHPFTKKYGDLIKLVTTPNTPIADIRKEYLVLIKDGDEATLKSTVFGSDKKGFLRGGMLSKTGGQIARSVLTPGYALRPDEVGIPRKLALDLTSRIPVTKEDLPAIVELFKEGHITHILHVRTGEYIPVSKLTNIKLEPGKMLVLRELQDGDVVLLNRQPTLHRNSIMGFKVVLHDGDDIRMHRAAAKAYGADFDGLLDLPSTVGCHHGCRSTMMGKQCKLYLARVYNLLVHV